VVAFACSQPCRQSSHDITPIRPQDAFRSLDGCIGHVMEIVRPERGCRVYRPRRSGSIRQVMMPPRHVGRSFRTVTKSRLRSRAIQWRGEPRCDGSGRALKVEAALAAVTAIEAVAKIGRPVRLLRSRLPKHSQFESRTKKALGYTKSTAI
jgi:hypothetical protein